MYLSAWKTSLFTQNKVLIFQSYLQTGSLSPAVTKKNVKLRPYRCYTHTLIYDQSLIYPPLIHAISKPTEAGREQGSRMFEDHREDSGDAPEEACKTTGSLPIGCEVEGLYYPVEHAPPWYLCLLFGFQVGKLVCPNFWYWKDLKGQSLKVNIMTHVQSVLWVEWGRGRTIASVLMYKIEK